MSRVRLFTGQQLEAIAKVIGDTETGLKGSEIGHILASAGIKDVSPDSTKWIRLYNAWVEDQNSTRMGNCVIKVITRAMVLANAENRPRCSAATSARNGTAPWSASSTATRWSRCTRACRPACAPTPGGGGVDPTTRQRAFVERLLGRCG